LGSEYANGLKQAYVQFPIWLMCPPAQIEHKEEKAMGTKFRAFALLALLAMLVGLAACGEQVIPTPTPANDLADITLVSFTSPEWGISGVAPDGWVEVFPGEFLRGMPDTDLTLLQHQFVLDITSEQLIATFVSEQGLKEFPESVGSIETAHFTWDLYTVEVKQPKIGTTAVDIALAETDAGVYAVALQVMPHEHDALHDAVFIPAVEALAPAVVTEDIPVDQAAVTLPERTYWPTDGWRTSTPEEQGMDSELLTEMLAHIEENRVRIDSVTIVRHGYLVLDAYLRSYEKGAKHELYSCTKSVTSALVGIAMDQGHIQSVDQPVLSFFPERTVANLAARKEAMTLEHLLTMTDGLDWVRKDIRFTSSGDTTPEMMQSSDWVQFTLDRRMAEEPGTRWNYNSGASHLLSAIIQETTGMTALELAQEYLFGPLGISEVVWSGGNQGRNYGGSRLQMTPHDMAKFGYLYLNEGLWDGEQIVPTAWVEASTTNHSPTPEIYYGYQWWVMPWAGYYSAIGARGQYIIVLPELDMVVVFTSDLMPEDQLIPLLLLAFYVIPSAKS
jgi:CubicO group peptidase (beta-lactamase class C family)